MCVEFIFRLTTQQGKSVAQLFNSPTQAMARSDFDKAALS